jgi:hypothetical protein
MLFLWLPGDFFETNDKYGPLYGKDHVAYAGDGMYEIVHVNQSDSLYSRYAGRMILMNSYGYTFKKGVLYFCSEEGYAVIYPENNLCKLLIFPEEYGEIRIVASEEYPLNELVVYLNSFDEFTDYEQEMLNKVTAAANGSGGFWDSHESFLGHEKYDKINK